MRVCVCVCVGVWVCVCDTLCVWVCVCVCACCALAECLALHQKQGIIFPTNFWPLLHSMLKMELGREERGEKAAPYVLLHCRSTRPRERPETRRANPFYPRCQKTPPLRLLRYSACMCVWGGGWCVHMQRVAVSCHSSASEEAMQHRDTVTHSSMGWFAEWKRAWGRTAKEPRWGRSQ